MKAFCFFDAHPDVNEEFTPRHLESLSMRLLDTFACVPVMMELFLAYQLGGLPALWVVYTSSWMSQTVTLWFNVYTTSVEPTPRCWPLAQNAFYDRTTQRRVPAPSVFAGGQPSAQDAGRQG